MLLILLGWLGIASISGCFGSGGQGSQGIDSLELAVERTIAARTAHVTWSESFGAGRGFQASGEVDFQQQAGTVAIMLGSGGQMRTVAELVLLDARLFLRDSRDGQWLPWEAEPGGAGDFLGIAGVPPGPSDLVDERPGETFQEALVRALGDLTAFQERGRAQVGNSSTTQYVAPVDKSDPTRALAVFLDDEGRIRRLEIPANFLSNPPAAGSILVEIEFSDFGKPVSVQDPTQP